MTRARSLRRLTDVLQRRGSTHAAGSAAERLLLLMHADDPPVRHAGPPALGLILLVMGVALGCVRVVHDVSGLPFSLPRFWYTGGVLWYAVAAALVGAGIAMQRKVPHLDTGWRPTERGLRFRTVILYTRPGCGLCDEAAEILSGYRRWMPAFEERNIDSDPLLTEHFGKCVPVVEIDGRVRFRGKVNEILLRRLIEATPPLDTRGGGGAV